MRTIFILMDSLNRHYLPCYGNDWVKAPNIAQLAQRGVTFDNHYCASMPCMPARRDLMNGRYNFLETPWGPLEPYDEKLPSQLRGITGPGNPGGRKDVYCHMITDHYHYWEWFGHGYHCFYDTWEFLRGQEGDNELPRLKDPLMPKARGKGVGRRQNWVNRAEMDTEDENQYPSVRCFQQAIDFLEHNHDQDNWFLHLEVFDPHEPFMCPDKYRQMYNDTWNGGYHYDWPNYAKLDPELDDPQTVAHIRKCYAGTLTMADTWLGKLLATMDRLDMWKDTNIVLTTDHGHMLGEHNYWAKNYMMTYNELANIPLIVAAPGADAGARRRGLTSAVDLQPSILALHGKQPGLHVHGQSFTPLLTAERPHHDSVLFGYFAKDINWTDGRYTYCRQPLPDTVTHHHTAMPVNAAMDWGMPSFAQAQTGHFLAHSPMPVYRAAIPSAPHEDAPDYNPIFDLQADPQQHSPIHDPALETELAGKLKAKLEQFNAPPCQYERCGL